MKRLFAVVVMLVLAQMAVAQGPFGPSQPLSQSFTENISTAPPAVSTVVTNSTSTFTGMFTSTTGGTVAAGTYRVCVTYYTSSNTETPCSADANSTIVTTGSTSTVTIQPPVTVGAAQGNVVGWRMYVSASAGATATETLQTITAAICTLSSSSTPSCALTSPAVFTSSAGFTAGSGGPATPGTAINPPVTNAVNTPIFENSLYTYRVVTWTVTGTAPGACTFNFQTGTTPGTLANVGQTITCTSSGVYAVPITTPAAYSAINVATYTAGDTTTKVTFNVTTSPYGPPIWYGPAAPTSACGAGVSGFFITTAVPSAIYTCVTTTWTAVTLP